MSKRAACIISLFVMATSFALAEERPMFLPFDVTLGGQKAAMKNGNEPFAQIDRPVKSDAPLVIAEQAAMLIINAFSCHEDGTVMENQPAAVIFAQNTSEVKLNATMDNKPLAPGYYLANVVAHNKTSRIAFRVGEPDSQVDFSKILSFLKKKSGGG